MVAAASTTYLYRCTTHVRNCLACSTVVDCATPKQCGNQSPVLADDLLCSLNDLDHVDIHKMIRGPDLCDLETSLIT